MPERAKAIRSTNIMRDLIPLLPDHYPLHIGDILLSSKEAMELNTLDGTHFYTALDLYSIAEEKATYELVEKMVKNFDGSDEELFEYLNRLIKEANEYLRSKEGLNIPQVLAFGKGERVKWDLPQISTREELERLLIELSPRTKSGAQRLRRIALCALAKVVLALDELQPDVTRTIRRDADAIEDLFLGSNYHHFGNNTLFDVRMHDSKIGACSRVSISTGSEVVSAEFCSRVKEPYSILTKMLLKPRFNKEEALKDAIGYRLIVKQKHILPVIKRILKFLTSVGSINSEIKISGLEINIKGPIVNSNDIEELSSYTGRLISIAALPDSHIPIYFDDDNLLSNSKYRDVKILFNVLMLGMDTPRGVEIQILDENSKNESGLSNHAVYKLKQKMAVFTRLYGSVIEKWLDEEIRDLVRMTNLGFTKVKDELWNKNTIKIIIKKGSKRARRMELEVFRRLSALNGLLPKQIAQYRSKIGT